MRYFPLTFRHPNITTTFCSHTNHHISIGDHRQQPSLKHRCTSPTLQCSGCVCR